VAKKCAAISERAVEQLARDLHEYHLRTETAKEIHVPPWKGMSRAWKRKYRETARLLLEDPPAVLRRRIRELEKPSVAVPPKEPRPEDACSGHGPRRTGPPCCDRAGEYNGYASGPLIFTCPKRCSCHD